MFLYFKSYAIVVLKGFLLIQFMSDSFNYICFTVICFSIWCAILLCTTDGRRIEEIC